MDWIYLLLTLAFFGLSVLLILGIEKTRETIMTGFYILGGIVALGLMVYLFIALLKPELF